MSKKKNSKTSRAALKRFRDSLIADDDNPAQESTDLDAHEELFYGALSQLRTIRVPGKKELTLEEAFEAALQQYEVFQNWCDSGKPLGEIRGCVEGREVFRVNEGFDLHAISFGVPPTDDAVLQITTEADGEEVVLYNLRLEDVPLDGLPHTEYWPNGQHISLTITRELGAAASQGSAAHSSEAKFRVQIAVNAEPFQQNAPIEELSFASEDSEHYEIEEDETSKKDINYRTKFPFFNWELWLTPLTSPVARLVGVLVWTVAIVAPMCFMFYYRQQPAQQTPAQQAPIATVRNQPEMAVTANNQNESLSDEAGKEVTKEPASTSSGFTVSKTSLVLNHAAKREPVLRSGGEANAMVSKVKTSDQVTKNRPVLIKGPCSQ